MYVAKYIGPMFLWTNTTVVLKFKKISTKILFSILSQERLFFLGTYFEKRHTKAWLFLFLFLVAFVLESIAQMKQKSRAKKK